MRLEVYTARQYADLSSERRYSRNRKPLIAKPQNFNSLPPRGLEQRDLTRTNHLGRSQVQATQSLRFHIQNLRRKDYTDPRRALTCSPHRYYRRVHRPFEYPQLNTSLFLPTRWLLKVRRFQWRSRRSRFHTRKMVQMTR